MIEYTNEGIITDKPEIAVNVWGVKEVLYNNRFTQERWHKIINWEWVMRILCEFNKEEGAIILVPYSVVWDRIQPVKGEGYIFDWPSDIDVNQEFNIHPEWSGIKGDGCYHKRVLNMITARDELRNLVSRIKEAKK